MTLKTLSVMSKYIGHVWAGYAHCRKVKTGLDYGSREIKIAKPQC